MTGRPQLPADFVAARKRRRILKALAELLVEKGYEATKIADIVKRAGVSRKTFYDNFGGKDAAVRALVEQALPELAKRVDLTSVHRTGLACLAVDLAALAVVGGGVAERASDVADDLQGVLDAVVIPEADPSHLYSLPPGRHGLPREFVEANQRERLLSGFATAVAEHGYNAVTIAHVTKAAAVSRRTFYEHFASAEAVGGALFATAAPGVLSNLKPGCPLRVLAVEVVAVSFTQGRDAGHALVDKAVAALEAVSGPKAERVAA